MEVTGAITLFGITDAIQVESCYKLTSRNLPPDTPHSTDGDGVIPEGWSGTLLGVSAIMPYLWESQRKKDGVSWSSWSRPVLKNSWGEKGAKMRSRVWKEGQYYTSGAQGEEFYDVVQYKEKLYLCTKTIEEPSKEGVNDPITSESKYLGIWKSAQEWDFIATQLLLTKKITADQIDVDSIFTGTIQANDATINNFNATNVKIKSGSIGGFRITSEGLFNDDENPKATIQIGRDGYRFFHVNPLSAGIEGGYMCQIRGDKLIALKIDGDIGIRVNGYSKAIVSFGNVELTARDTEHISINGLKVNYRWVEDAEVHLKTSDDYIFAGGNARNIYMPSNAKPGKIIYFKADGFRGQLRGYFRNSNNAGTHWDHGITSDVSRMYIYDGEAWTEFFCG